MPKISIVVPNYNHSKYLPLRLESILNQTFQDFEIILLDDCSTDNSKEILERYKDHPKVSHTIYNRTNSGSSYKQWYKGIDLAEGELIWIAESDDWCEPVFLEALVNYFDDDKVSIAFAGSHFVYSECENQNAGYSGSFVKSEGNDFVRDKMLARNHIYNASMVLFRKRNYLMVKDKGFLDMKLAGDWFLWIQMMGNYKIVSIPDKLNYCRRHTTNATGRFRALGYDFIEGLSVLSVGKKMCKNKFDRKQVYLSWINCFNIYKLEFAAGVKNRVLLKFLRKEPALFFFLVIFQHLPHVAAYGACADDDDFFIHNGCIVFFLSVICKKFYGAGKLISCAAFLFCV